MTTTRLDRILLPCVVGALFVWGCAGMSNETKKNLLLDSGKLVCVALTEGNEKVCCTGRELVRAVAEAQEKGSIPKRDEDGGTEQ